MKAIAERLSDHYDFTSQVAVPMARYYKGQINKYELIGHAATILYCYHNAGKCENTNLAGFIEWLDGMAEEAKNALPIASSGSFWTALWDVDFVSSLLSDEEMEGPAYEDFERKMNSGWRAGFMK
jgi:hypothetical protein